MTCRRGCVRQERSEVIHKGKDGIVGRIYGFAGALVARAEVALRIVGDCRRRDLWCNFALPWPLGAMRRNKHPGSSQRIPPPMRGLTFRFHAYSPGHCKALGAETRGFANYATCAAPRYERKFFPLTCSAARKISRAFRPRAMQSCNLLLACIRELVKTSKAGACKCTDGRFRNTLGERRLFRGGLGLFRHLNSLSLIRKFKAAVRRPVARCRPSRGWIRQLPRIHSALRRWLVRGRQLGQEPLGKFAAVAIQQFRDASRFG